MCKYVRRHSKAYNSGRCQRAGGIKLRAPPFHPTICSSVRTSAPLGSPCTSKLIIKSQRSRNNMRWMSPCTIYIQWSIMVGLNSNILNSLHYIMQAAIFGFVLRPGFEPWRYIPGRLAPRLHRKHTKKLAWPGHEANPNLFRHSQPSYLSCLVTLSYLGVCSLVSLFIYT